MNAAGYADMYVCPKQPHDSALVVAMPESIGCVRPAVVTAVGSTQETPVELVSGLPKAPV